LVEVVLDKVGDGHCAAGDVSDWHCGMFDILEGAAEKVSEVEAAQLSQLRHAPDARVDEGGDWRVEQEANDRTDITAKK
jgi:hypothetical protein